MRIFVLPDGSERPVPVFQIPDPCSSFPSANTVVPSAHTVPPEKVLPVILWKPVFLLPVITGAWQVEGLEGVAVTTYAFQNGLPFPAQVSSFVLMLCLVFFAFTTILGWDYYSERCLEYLSGGNMKHVKIYRWIYILAVFIGPYMTVSAVWTIADIFNGLMALPNMIALFALSGVVVKETKSFFERHNNEKL